MCKESCDEIGNMLVNVEDEWIPEYNLTYYPEKTDDNPSATHHSYYTMTVHYHRH